MSDNGKPPAITTKYYDNFRSGCWPYEQKLTSSYVQSHGISKFASIKLLDPRGSEGQPLIVPDVRMRDGQTHDAIYVGDMSGNAYAIDINAGRVLWQQPIANPVVVTKQWDFWQLNPRWSILSTGVIDLQSQTWHVLALSSVDGSMQNAAYYLHSLSLIDGRPNAPPLLLNNATHQPLGGGKLQTLGATPRKQRPALTLVQRGNRTFVYVAFGSFLESSALNLGWIVAVETTNLKPEINATWTSGSGLFGAGSGLWMAGQGLSADEDGALFGVTGNGAFHPPTGDYGNSAMKIIHDPSAGTMAVATWITLYSDAGMAGDDPTLPSVHSMGEAVPANMMNMAGMSMSSNVRGATDVDLGSGGLPHLAKSITGFSRNIVIACGKTGIGHVADADAMGDTQNADLAPDRIAGNYAKLLTPPYGLTYYPGGVNLMSPNMTDIPTLYGGYTRHMHATAPWYRSPDHGVMMFPQGENGPVRAIVVKPDFSLNYLACGTEIASAGMPAPGGMPGGFGTISCAGQGTNTAVLWQMMPLNGDANQRVVPGRLVAYGANWDQNGTLVKLWDSAQQGWNYSHNKFNNAITWDGRVVFTTYDGTIEIAH